MEWFRFYEDTLDNPKVQQLPGEFVKGWLNLLCLANSGDGVLPPLRTIAFRLRISETEAQTLLQRLIQERLIDQQEGYLEMHDWAEFQRSSDDSAPRVRRYRENQKLKRISQSTGENGAKGEISTGENEAKADVTLHVTLPSRDCNGLETETETEEKRNTLSAPQASQESAFAPFSPSEEKPSEKAKSPLQETVDTVAAHIKERHPEIRNGLGAGAIGNKLLAILRRHSVRGEKAVTFLEALDERHRHWCATEQWQANGGVYAKALANWLAPTQDRYLEEPPNLTRVTTSSPTKERPATSFPREIYGPEPEEKLTPERISELREQAEDPNPTIAAAARLMLSQMPLPEVSPWKN